MSEERNVDKRRAAPAEVTYLDAERSVAEFVDAIAGVRELAVDTEGASFHRFVDRVYLLQVSTRARHAILDPLAIAPPRGLGALLADANVEVVFHDAEYDLRLLYRDFGWRVRGLFDTRVAAQLLGIRQFGLAALLESHFGVTLDKKHQRADWSMRPLTPPMLAYAAQDTMHLLALRDEMRAALEKKGRASWAKEEFARSEGAEWPADETGSAFLRMKGARDLTRRELAVLRELVAWRDSVAAEIDRAAFRVLGNEPLLEIAHLMPDNASAITAIKGVPRGWSPARVADVLAAVARGKAVPEEDLPKFPKGQRWDRDPKFDERVNALRAVRDSAATRLDLEPGVLCARERLEAVARRVPSSVDDLREVKELRRWQIEVLGDEMVRAVAKV